MTSSESQSHFSERFWSKVDRRGDDECWAWLASKDRDGYGFFCVSKDRSDDRAYRVAYRLLVGPIPRGTELDHLCRNRRCVNPDHLEQVTMAENLRRGMGWAGLNARKTHCAKGHPYNAENTYRPPSRNGWRERECWTCKAERKRRYRKVAREARQASA